MDYDTWAIDIGKVISELILRDARLAGFSMGGAIEAHYVARRIDTRISKLALISAPVVNAYPRPEDRQTAENQLKGLLADRPKFMVDHVKRMVNMPMTAENREWLASLGMQASLRACIRGLEELRAAYDPWADYVRSAAQAWG